MSAKTTARAQVANRLGIDIAEAESNEQLDTISMLLENEYSRGHLYSHEYERLCGYINHRRIIVKQSKEEIVEVGCCKATLEYNIPIDGIKEGCYYSYQKNSKNEYQIGIPFNELSIVLSGEKFESNFMICENYNTIIGGKNAAANA